MPLFPTCSFYRRGYGNSEVMIKFHICLKYFNGFFKACRTKCKPLNMVWRPPITWFLLYHTTLFQPLKTTYILPNSVCSDASPWVFKILFPVSWKTYHRSHTIAQLAPTNPSGFRLDMIFSSQSFRTTLDHLGVPFFFRCLNYSTCTYHAEL